MPQLLAAGASGSGCGAPGGRGGVRGSATRWNCATQEFLSWHALHANVGKYLHLTLYHPAPIDHRISGSGPDHCLKP